MSYYYLISGLPDLSLDKAIDDKGKRQVDIDELMDTILRNLEPEDVSAIRYLVYPNDNYNFLSVLLQKHHDIPSVGYLQPALLDKEVIEEYQKNQSNLAPYMSDYIRSFEDQFTSMSPREMEDRLWQIYYEEVQSSDTFIADYVLFERQVKQFFAAYNDSYFDFLKAPLFEGSRMGQIGAGKSLPGDIIRQHPFVEKMGEIVASEDPIRIAAFSDKIIWDYLDQTTGFFGKEQVFVYTIRLMMVARWQNRDKDAGTAQFTQLQEDIKNKVRSLKIAVI